MNKILKELRESKPMLKTLGMFLGLMIGSNFAWFFILPLSASNNQLFQFIRYGPMVSTGLIILWAFISVLKKQNKQQAKPGVEQK